MLHLWIACSHSDSIVRHTTTHAHIDSHLHTKNAFFLQRQWRRCAPSSAHTLTFTDALKLAAFLPSTTREPRFHSPPHFLFRFVCLTCTAFCSNSDLVTTSVFRCAQAHSLQVQLNMKGLKDDSCLSTCTTCTQHFQANVVTFLMRASWILMQHSMREQR